MKSISLKPLRENLIRQYSLHLLPIFTPEQFKLTPTPYNFDEDIVTEERKVELNPNTMKYFYNSTLQREWIISNLFI